MIPHDDNTNASPERARLESMLEAALRVDRTPMPASFGELLVRGAQAGRASEAVGDEQLRSVLASALETVDAPATLDRRVEAGTGLELAGPRPVPLSRRFRIVAAGVAAAVLLAIAVSESAAPSPREGPRLVLQRVETPLGYHGLGASSLIRAGQAKLGAIGGERGGRGR